MTECFRTVTKPVECCPEEEMETDDSPAPDSNQSEVEALREQTEHLKLELEAAHAKIHDLEQKVSVSSFGVQRFSSDPALLKFYTGFWNYEIFIAFFEFVEPMAKSMASAYYTPVNDFSSLSGKPRSMLLIDELFMLLLDLFLFIC